MDINLGNIKPERIMGMSDYVRSQMPTPWSSTLRYTFPKDQQLDGKNVRRAYVKLLWLCEGPLKTAEWGMWAEDSNGKEVVDKRMDFEMDDIPYFKEVAGANAELGKLVCANAKK